MESDPDPDNLTKFCRQGCNEVRCRPGQLASLEPPCSKLRSFGSKCTVLKKVLVALLGLFGVPRSHSAPLAVIWRPFSDLAPGELCPPCPPRYAPACRIWILILRAPLRLLCPKPRKHY